MPHQVSNTISGIADGVVEYRTQDDCNDAMTAGAERTGEKRGVIDGHGNVHPSSDIRHLRNRAGSSILH